MAVELHLVPEDVAGVGPQLDLVGHFGRSPDLGRVPHAVVPLHVDERDRVVALDAAVGGKRVAVLAGQVEESGLAEREPDVAGQRVHVAVAGQDATVHPVAGVAEEVPAALELDRAAGAVVAEHEVHHAGDGVGAVLGRRAVAQHLGLLERQSGNERDVGALRTVCEAVAVPGDDGRAVAPLPVDQHQRVIRREAAKVRGPREGRRVRNRLNVDVERRDHVAQQVGEVGVALLNDVRRRDHVDGYGRFGHRSRLGAATDCDQAFELQCGRNHGRVEPGGLARGDRDLGPIGLIADQDDRHIVRAGRNVRDRVAAVGAAVGAQVEVRKRHLRARQRGAGALHGHGALEGSLLCEGRRGQKQRTKRPEQE